jgi:ubiquinone/menaquinone biosynthesis C-methylase UbiE
VRPLSDELATMYEHRFSDEESAGKHDVWKVICAHLQRSVDRDGVVLDVACDRGYFIENIEAREKWAADVRDVSEYLSEDVHFVQSDGLDLDRRLPHDTFDVVFMSNYLEHLDSGDDVVRQLEVARVLLRPHGKLLVLQPNIRLVGQAYWDFIDHKVALTEHSLEEAAEVAGLRTTRVVTRFLPYTTKRRLPASPRLARLYLALRPAWFLFGKQTLFEAERPA